MILPSLSGLYFLILSLIKNNYSDLAQIFLSSIIAYLFMIIYKNISYLFKNSYFKNKLIYFVILNLSFLLFYFQSKLLANN